MNDLNKKKVYSSIGILVTVLLIGVSYAFFTYSRVGEKESQLIAGDIYLNYTEDGDTLVLTNAFPETKEEATSRDDNYITFTVDGKNTTTNKDIYYEILLSNGSDIEGKTRFNPKDIKIELKETIDGVTETVVDGISYLDFNERRIWVNTVNRNTQDEVLITYQLRMWISEDVIISDTEDYANYTTEEFHNGYASVKVNVKGDFEYKEVSTDVSCFAYQDVLDYKLNTSTEAVATCKDFFLNDMSDGEDRSDAGDGY